MPNGLKTALLLGLLTGVLLALGDALGGANGLVVAFVFAVIMNFGSYWFSDKIVLRMYNAQPVGPDNRLYGIVQRLAQRDGLPMPKVYIVPDPSPNAFATGRNPHHAAVVATEGILGMLDDNEMEGVLAHELTHVKNRDILTSSVAATIAAVIMMAARWAQYAAIFGGYGGYERDRDRGMNPIALLATVILAPIAALLIQMWISRTREYAADAGGARLAGNPYGLVNALQKIDAAAKQIPLNANPATAHMFIIQPFTRGMFASLFSDHPPTEDRIRALLGGIR